MRSNHHNTGEGGVGKGCVYGMKVAVATDQRPLSNHGW